MLCLVSITGKTRGVRNLAAAGPQRHTGAGGRVRQVSCHLVKGRVLRKEAAQQGSPLGMRRQQGWERHGGAMVSEAGPEQGEPQMTSTQQVPCYHLSAFSHGSNGNTGGRNSVCVPPETSGLRQRTGYSRVPSKRMLLSLSRAIHHHSSQAVIGRQRFSLVIFSLCSLNSTLDGVHCLD